MRVGNVEASKLVIGPMPLLPAVMFAQAVATSLPTGLTMPRPVTTTLRFMVHLCDRPRSRELERPSWPHSSSKAKLRLGGAALVPDWEKSVRP